MPSQEANTYSLGMSLDLLYNIGMLNVLIGIVCCVYLLELPL